MSGFGHAPFGHHPFGHGGIGGEPIQDIAFNALLSPSAAQMLGWTEPEAGESFGLDIYRFILSIIREEDEKATLFLKRFLQGPQAVWETTQTKIFAVKSLWDVANVDAAFLPYLQTIVGWTGDLTKIPDALETGYFVNQAQLEEFDDDERVQLEARALPGQR